MSFSAKDLERHARLAGARLRAGDSRGLPRAFELGQLELGAVPVTSLARLAMVRGWANPDFAAECGFESSRMDRTHAMVPVTF